MVMKDIPHEWLLPRCKAPIHHGGACTTAAALHSGIPNITITFAADQPFWGARVQAIGAGPCPIPVRKLTVEKLIEALVETEGEAVRNDAQATGRKIRAENGIATAVKVIEDFACKELKS